MHCDWVGNEKWSHTLILVAQHGRLLRQIMWRTLYMYQKHPQKCLKVYFWHQWLRRWNKLRERQRGWEQAYSFVVQCISTFMSYSRSGVPSILKKECMYFERSRYIFLIFGTYLYVSIRLHLCGVYSWSYFLSSLTVHNYSTSQVHWRLENIWEMFLINKLHDYAKYTVFSFEVAYLKFCLQMTGEYRCFDQSARG